MKGNYIKFLLVAILISLITVNLDLKSFRIAEKIIEFSTGEIGISLLGKFILPFEILSLLLTAAMVGAIVIAKKEDDAG